MGNLILFRMPFSDLFYNIVPEIMEVFWSAVRHSQKKKKILPIFAPGGYNFDPGEKMTK